MSTSRARLPWDPPVGPGQDALSGPRFGVSGESGFASAPDLDEVARAVGVQPRLVMSFCDFACAPPIAGMDMVAGRGAVPIVTWEPWWWAHRGAGSAPSVRSVAVGVHDEYLATWAGALAEWGGPIGLRFAHEPNGGWYPWGAATNSGADYIAAWRHVHAVFRRHGAHNVSWIWAPTVSFPGSASVAAYYPGDDVVDVVGLDGYNWGRSRAHSIWTQPRALFEPTLDELRPLAPGCPRLLTEVACAESGGSKPEWIGRLIQFLADRREIAGFVWFDHDKEVDWRMISSPESVSAFARAIGEGCR